MAEGSEEEEGGEGGGEGAAAGPSAEALEEAMELLTSTPWDGDVEALRPAREQLAGLLRVTLPEAVAGRVRAAPKAVRRDENESYQSLLDDAARGGGY